MTSAFPGADHGVKFGPSPTSGAAQTEPSPFSPDRSLRHYLSVADLTTDGILSLLDDALELKRFGSRTDARLAGRTAALVFQKPSLRTRVSFEVAMLQLGAHAGHL